ncbi:MAG: hypothetical protein AAGE52_08515 [Myxococcota bacterium]
MTACVPRPPATVTRVVGGESRTGPFVSPFAYEHFIRGEMALEQEDFQTAINEFELARAGPEDDVLVISRLALAHERAGNAEAADRALAAGASLDAESEALWLARAEIAARRGDSEAAIDAAVRAAEIAPDSEAPILQLAELLRAADATPRADAVLSQNGSSPVAARARLVQAIATEDARAAGEALEQLLRIAPARVGDIERSVRIALADGQTALGLRLLAHLDADRFADLRARTLLAAGRAEEASVFLQTTASDVFGGPGAHAALALEAGLTDEAIALAESAVALGDLEANLVLGHALLAKSKPTRAAEAFGRVPRGSRRYEDARDGLRRALTTAALPELAQEIGRVPRPADPDS